MNIRYIVTESFSGFRRAKLSSAISVVTIAISLVLLGTFIVVTLNAVRILNQVRSRVEVEFFLSDAISKKEAKELLADIQQTAAVKNAIYISKDSAAAIFQKEFGENIVAILDANPLPQSIKTTLKPDYVSLDSLEAFVKEIKELDGILDSRFNREFISGLDRNAKILFYITAGLGIIISIAAVALISNTIRLAIYAKRDIIKTMKLVGATQTFVRLPFLIEGILQGFIGGTMAVGLLALVLFGVEQYYYTIYSAITVPNAPIYLMLLALGIMLGFFGSAVSVRKFINEA